MPARFPAPTVPWLPVLALGTALLILLGAALIAPGDGAAARTRTEHEAVARLRELLAKQRAFAAARAIDADADGKGEFGFLAELGGGARLRLDAHGHLGPTTLAQPLLPTELSPVHDHCVDDGTYLFQVWLPAADGGFVTERAEGGGAGVAVATDRAEVELRAFAWPTATGRGQFAFCIDGSGRVRVFDNGDRRYCDRELPPPVDAPDQGAWRPIDGP